MRVLEALTELFCRKYACDPEDITMSATLDELNIAPFEREDMAVVLGELYGVTMDAAAIKGFETVEDVVGFVEDKLIEKEEMR